MAEKHLDNCSTSLLISKMQIKIAQRFHLIPIRMVKIKKKSQVTADASKDVEQGE